VLHWQFHALAELHMKRQQLPVFCTTKTSAATRISSPPLQVSTPLGSHPHYKFSTRPGPSPSLGSHHRELRRCLFLHRLENHECEHFADEGLHAWNPTDALIKGAELAAWNLTSMRAGGAAPKHAIVTTIDSVPSPHTSDHDGSSCIFLIAIATAYAIYCN
jgi:hypothetical protein